jgi:hypothetical protein
MKWKKNAVSRQHNISERRVLFSFFLCSLSCAVIFYIYCVRTAKLFRRGWMSRWAARWLAAGIAIYAHQMKREMTSNIFSSILYRCWGIDGGFSAVCIISPHSPELDEPTSFFPFLRPFFIPSIAFLSLPIRYCSAVYRYMYKMQSTRQLMVKETTRIRIGRLYWPVHFFFLYIQRICHSNGPFRLYQIPYRHAVVVQKSKRKENLAAWSEPEDI